MKHQCNAYCRGNRHAEMGYRGPLAVGRATVYADDITRYFGPGVRKVRIRPMPKATIPDWARRCGLTHAYLAIVEVPKEGGEAIT